jgi:hypothetical protein
MAKARAAKAQKAIAQQPIIESVVNEMGHADDSPHQITLLKSVYGLPLTAGELAIFRSPHGANRQEYPGHPFPESTVITGAQSGKTGRIAAPIAV